MAHRGVPERGRWWKLKRDLLTSAVILVTASVLYILLSLVVHGSVIW